MAFLEKLLASVIGSLIMFGLIGALLWFGAPKLWSHVMDAEAALRERPSLLATIQADRTDASTTQASCEARVGAAYKAGAQLSKINTPQPRTNGVQPAWGADAIRSIVNAP